MSLRFACFALALFLLNACDKPSFIANAATLLTGGTVEAQADDNPISGANANAKTPVGAASGAAPAGKNAPSHDEVCGEPPDSDSDADSDSLNGCASGSNSLSES